MGPILILLSTFVNVSSKNLPSSFKNSLIMQLDQLNKKTILEFLQFECIGINNFLLQSYEK